MYLYLLQHEYKDNKTNEIQSKDRSGYSEMIVRQLLLDYCTRQELDFADEILAGAFAIEREAKGKPFFRRLQPANQGAMPELHFSVSHSGTWWGCLIAEEPVGFDMEICRNNVDYLKIARRFFTEEEYDLVHSGGQDVFFDIWVRKEAYVKYKGSGLGEGLRTFSVALNAKLADEVICGKSGNHTRCPCFIRPIEIAGGVRAAYCSSSGNPVKTVILQDFPRIT